MEVIKLKADEELSSEFIARQLGLDIVDDVADDEVEQGEPIEFDLELIGGAKDGK